MNTHASTDTQHTKQEFARVRERGATEMFGLGGAGDVGLVVARVGFTATDDLWQ